MDTKSFALEALAALSPVVLAVLTWLGARLAALIQAKVRNEYLRGALVRLDDAVFTAVKAIQQDTVAAIKKASADGRLTDDEVTEIRRAAVDSVKAQLGLKGLAELARILGLSDGVVETFLGNKVEAAVHDLRTTSPQ